MEKRKKVEEHYKENSGRALNAGMWYIVGNMLLKGIVFLTLPIFTRLLPTSDYGLYNTYVAYETIVTGVIGLGLYGSVKRAKIDFREKFDEYISSITFMGLFVLLGMLLVINCIYPVFQHVLPFERWVVIILLFHGYGSFVIQIYNAKLNMEFKYKSFILIAFLNTVSNILISVYLILNVFQYNRYIGRVLGYAIPPIVIGLVLTIVMAIRGKKVIDGRYWKYGALIGLPLVPHVLSQTLLSQFDRVMIQSIVGDSEAGIYSFIYTISTILFIVHQSLDSAWTPWVYYRINSEEKADVKEKSKLYILFFSIMTVGFICVVPEIIKLMSARDYWVGMNLIVPTTLSTFCIFLYTLPVNIEYYNKKTAFISAGTVGAAIVDVVLNSFFIRLLGYEAAAYTTLFSYILLFVFHLLIAQKYEFNDCYDIKWIGLCSLAVFIIGLIIRLSEQNIILRYSVVVIILAYLLVNKHTLLSAIKDIKN